MSQRGRVGASCLFHQARSILDFICRPTQSDCRERLASKLIRWRGLRSGCCSPSFSGWSDA